MEIKFTKDRALEIVAKLFDTEEKKGEFIEANNFLPLFEARADFRELMEFLEKKFNL